MLKKINRVLRLVGLNLVRAKRKKTPWTKLPPYTREELENCPLECAANQPGTVPLSDYIGQSEWHDTPPPVAIPNPGRTHYVGDDCPGGHRDLEQPRVEQPNSDNKISGPTS